MLRKTSKHKQKDAVEHDESDVGESNFLHYLFHSLSLFPDDDEFIVSGWGDEEQDLSDDLLKQWHFMLEKWDGRDKWDPKGDKTRSRQLVKLVRKVTVIGKMVEVEWYPLNITLGPS